MSYTRDPRTDQPLPEEGRTDIHEYVISRLSSWGVGVDDSTAIAAGLRERLKLGVSKYGRPLQSHNGRDALKDAWEEALDCLVYLQQMELEEDPVEIALNLQAAVVVVLARKRIERGDWSEETGGLPLVLE